MDIVGLRPGQFDIRIFRGIVMGHRGPLQDYIFQGVVFLDKSRDLENWVYPDCYWMVLE